MATFLSAALPYLAQLGGSTGGFEGLGGLANALGGGNPALGSMAGSTMAGGMQGPTQGSGLMGALSGGGLGALQGAIPSFTNNIRQSSDEKKAAPAPAMGLAMTQPSRFVNGLGRY